MQDWFDPSQHLDHPSSPVTSRRQALGLGAAACIAQISRAPATAPLDPAAEPLDLCHQLDADSRDLRRECPAVEA